MRTPPASLSRALLAGAIALALAVPAASALPTASAAADPVNGKPCPTRGKVVKNGMKSWTCIKLGAKLVWKVTAWPDLGAQPSPVDGKWLVSPGYPTDLPPGRWRGEPAWFTWNWDIPTAQSVGTCSSTKPLTNYLTDPAALDSITPQGFTQPGFHALPVPHMYYQTGAPTTVTEDAEGQTYVSEKVPVRAPANMVLRGVATNVRDDSLSYKEYMLSFSICGRLWLFLAHMDDLSAPIRNAMRTAPATDNGNTCKWPDDCTYIYLSLRVKAGDLIGMSSGRSGGFDVGLADMSGTSADPLTPSAKRLNPSTYSPRWAASRCHIAYYGNAAKRAALEALLDGDNGCGQLVSDRRGTPAGVWLDPAYPSTREDFHVALVRDSSTAALQQFSFGNDSGIPGFSGAHGGVFTFTPQQSGANRSFYGVGLGEVVCYDALEPRVGATEALPTVYIEVTPGSAANTERLTIGVDGAGPACGAGPWVMPAVSRTFQRGTSMTR